MAMGQTISLFKDYIYIYINNTGIIDTYFNINYSLTI